MIASLGMYDRPETAAANDRLWALIRNEFRADLRPAPDALTRGDGAFWPAWADPELVFSQTCGFPFRATLHGHVTLIGTPDYGVENCPPGYYNSVFVARKDDPRATLAEFNDADFAYNDDMSQSGWAAPQNHAIAMGLRLRPALCSGGHKLSAIAVAETRADLAAIDCVTWKMLQRWEPFTQDLCEVARTKPTPGLPYIAALGAPRDLLFAAVARAIAALGAYDRDLLMLKGIVQIPSADYLAVPTPPTPGQVTVAAAGR